MAILLALTLAGCGGEDPAASGQAETVRIGFLAAGDRVTYVDAAGIAVTDANESGGVLGMPVELVSSIGIEETSVSVEIAERMIVEDGVVALVGPNRSSHAIAVAELAQRHGLPMVTTSATNPEVTRAGDFVFMAAFTDMFQGQVMAKFAREQLGPGQGCGPDAKGRGLHRGDIGVLPVRFRRVRRRDRRRRVLRQRRDGFLGGAGPHRGDAARGALHIRVRPGDRIDNAAGEGASIA